MAKSSSTGPVRELAARVRAKRLAAEISVAELARRCDVTPSFISQLESGRTSLSLSTLYQVAAALDCTANALLTPTEEKLHLTRPGEGPRLPASGGPQPQHPRLLSTTGPGVLLEAYHFSITSGDDPQEWFQHTGEDFLFMLKGAITVEFGDGREILLKDGDALHHGGDVPHRWILQSDEPAEVLNIVVFDPTPQRPGGRGSHGHDSMASTSVPEGLASGKNV